MVGEVIAGLGAIKTAFDLAKGLKDIDDATRRNAAIIELQEKILTAHSAQAALIQRVGDLEKEVAGFETWETEKQRYELKDIGLGSLAHVIKEAMRGSEPPHQICAVCYEHRKKSILQPDNVYGFHTLRCPECQTVLKIKHHDFLGLA
jgi:hypothetical protein